MDCKLPGVLQTLILSYLCPLETPFALSILDDTKFKTSVDAWTISLQKKTSVLKNMPASMTQNDHLVITTVNDIWHRVDGPAVEYFDGTKKWFYHGKLHRDNDAPAIEYSDGTNVWYQNGQLHRINGPAIAFSNGSTLWYQHGLLHRDQNDEPAVEYLENSAEWDLAINIIQKYRCDFNEFVLANIGHNNRQWFKFGKRHRIDGPAFVDFKNYMMVWYKDGEIHRDNDKPAFISLKPFHKYKRWYQNGDLHRVDGPAIEDEDGHCSYFLNGISQTTQFPTLT